MYNQMQINQFRANLESLKNELNQPLHPESIRMIKSDIKRIESILADYPEATETTEVIETIEESEKMIEFNTPIKWSKEDTELFHKINTLTVTNIKKADHFPKYFEVVKLVELASLQVNRYLFDIDGFEMGLYKRAVFDKTTKKECDKHLSNVKRWMLKTFIECMKVRYN